MAEKGRPTLFTDDLAREICFLLSIGQSLRQICRADDMPEARTVHYWLNDKPDFFQQYTQAREIQADTLFDECLDIADQQEDDVKTIDGVDQTNHDVIGRARLRIDTRKWMAGKLKSKYSDKVVNEHVGKDGGPIETKDMSDIEMARRVAFMLQKGLHDKKEE